MTKANSDEMNALHSLVAEALANLIQSGDAKPADIANAIRFLKDNGIEADMELSAPLTSLAHQFPEFDVDEENELSVN